MRNYNYFADTSDSEFVITVFSNGGEDIQSVRITVDEGIYETDQYAGTIVYRIPRDSRGTVSVAGDLWFGALGTWTKLPIGTCNGGFLPGDPDGGWSEGETPEGLADGVGWHW